MLTDDETPCHIKSMNNETPTKKPHQKKGKKHLSPEEKGKIIALLELKLFSSTEIAEKVGRSHDIVSKIAHENNIELIGVTKRSEEYKLRLAEKFGCLADRMLDNIQKASEKELSKISLAQRMMASGIATDKMLALTKEKDAPGANLPDGATLSWVQLVQVSTPPRAKDELTPNQPIEEAQIIKEKLDAPDEKE